MFANVVAVAQSQLGVHVRPRGSNKGPEVNKYLASVSINFPAAWCTAFVYWCHEQAGISGVPKTGGALDMWNKAPKNRVTHPQPGDVVIFDYGGGKGHTGIIEAVDGDTLTTIEGNTNDDGSREGYEVARRQRSAGGAKGFLRF